MRIDQGYEFTKDTIASILTSGLLGEVYIGLDSGGDTKMLADGGKIAKTQSARRAREADRAVPVRQGRERGGPKRAAPREAAQMIVRRWRARRLVALAAALLAGCAATPSQRTTRSSR